MESKEKHVSSIVTLQEQAMRKLASILNSPATPEQKKSLQQSIGVYSLYQKKWQKKAQ